MAKQGFTTNSAPNILSQVSSKEGWYLCIGAGTSRPLFPDWHTLFIRLMEQDSSIKTDSESLAKKLLQSYSADSLIAAAFNKLNLTSEDLSEALYKDIMSVFEIEEWREFAQILGDSTPSAWTEEHWQKFISKIESNWSEMTCVQIAKVIAKTLGTIKQPKGILSFNAEPMLYALLNCYGHRLQSNNRRPFDIVLRSTSSRASDRIPYIFVHGLLPIPRVEKRRNRFVSGDKLVFSETEYLNLSNSNYSWQSTQFVSAASNNRIVFIGVSMSDPNMRKWLSWIHSMRLKEIAHHGVKKTDSTQHYWINKKPTDADESRWIESSVAHLGIRMIWIDEWCDVEKVLTKMVS